MGYKRFKKFIKEWKWTLMLLAVCIAGIPLTTIYGIQSVTWGNDFWPNALSEFLGMFVDLIFGALFTFVVIDKYLQYHKGKQWQKIKNITYKNLYFTLSNILLKLNLALPKEMRAGAYVLTEDMETLNDYLPKEDFDIVSNTLISSINEIVQKKHATEVEAGGEFATFNDEALHGALIKFKQHSKADITAISNLVIPKLLNFSDDTDMLDNVIELEEVFTSLMSKINNVHRKPHAGATLSTEIKYIWLIKIQEILKRITTIADTIQDDVGME